MIYKPFKTAQDFESLIHLGETPESIHWDYKQMFNPKEPDNIAIDLAAFANTYGGTLLIGIAEKKINDIKVASSFVPNVDAEEIRKVVNTRIHEIISPKIDVQVVPIEVSGSHIVAVNVEPSINLVGVCLDRDRRQYSFPYRTEYGNQYMIFEEVEKRMVDNKTRAMFLKLKEFIPEKEKVMIYPVPMCNNRSEWTLEWVHNSKNEVKLERDGAKSIIVPISFIEEVWKGNVGVCIKMNSRLYCGSDFIDFEDSERVENIKALSKIWARRT
jgi:hypothetical protein